ncbi:hypothetical protein DYY65_04345 [Nitrososphaera sp. AFS]|nr:hypothetical protein [Nitrososphaera sp. AFS]
MDDLGRQCNLGLAGGLLYIIWIIVVIVIIIALLSFLFHLIFILPATITVTEEKMASEWYNSIVDNRSPKWYHISYASLFTERLSDIGIILKLTDITTLDSRTLQQST